MEITTIKFCKHNNFFKPCILYTGRIIFHRTPREDTEAKVGVDKVELDRGSSRDTVQKIEIHDQRKAHIIKAH